MIVERNLWIITLAVAGVIVYGSLYPFEFHRPAVASGPIGELIGSWSRPPSSFGDLAANILLYVPLGFFEVLAFAKTSAARRFALALCSGFGLCTMIELAQYYDVGRITNASDLYLNTFGTGIGATGGLLIGSNFRWPLLREMSAKPVPALLLVGWLGYRLFPYVPTIDLHKYWDSLKPVVLSPNLTVYELCRSIVAWTAVALMIEAIAGRDRSRWLYLGMVAFVLCARIAILTNTITIAELLGSLAAFAVWLAPSGASPRLRALPVAALFGLLVAAGRLEPFQFRSTAGHFSVVPFASLMRGSLSLNIQSFLEKFFLYGGSIWLISETGVSWAWSTALIVGLLLLTGLGEIYLPGRSAEITDPVMALIIGVIFALMTRAEAYRTQ